MTWTARLLAAVLALPAPWASPDTGRPERLAMVVDVAVEVTADGTGWAGWSHRQRAALLVAKLAAESGNFRLSVHDGTKRSDHGESICLGQIRYGHWLPMTRPEWLALAGTDRDSTRRCLAEAWRQLGLHRRLCGGVPSIPSVQRVYSSYGTGQGCSPRTWALPRARQFARLAG